MDSQQQVLDRRRAGVVLHPTSLPGPEEHGVMGPDAYYFVDWLCSTGLSVWQMLPLGPTHEDGSPYQCLSSHAGNAGLISLQLLVQRGWLSEDELTAKTTKRGRLVKARQGWIGKAGADERQAYAEFVARHRHWLDDYALFTVLREHHGNQSWLDWPAALRDRKPAALDEAHQTFAEEIDQVRFEQYLFFSQFAALRRYANERGILLFGDMPIFVAFDSADVWSRRDYFLLDKKGRPTVVAGVPPDYFSATGQRWGNPLYDWRAIAVDGFAWWIERLRTQLALFDFIRIDHFRGFEAYWEIPADKETAMEGKWVHAPGDALFRTILEKLGRLPLVAEDLGIITDEVTALRKTYGLPGMKILQFAFGEDARNPYLPHNHEADSVVYTGTHDNDTTAGWDASLAEHTRRHVQAYLGTTEKSLLWPLIRSAFASVAPLAMVPMQDLLELGAAHRMNTPGTPQGNWGWRYDWSQVKPEMGAKVKELVSLYGR